MPKAMDRDKKLVNTTKNVKAHSIRTKTGMKTRFFPVRELIGQRFTEEKFDEAFPDGVYVVPLDKEEPLYNFRAIIAYCKEHGIDTADLTDEQLKMFEVKRT